MQATIKFSILCGVLLFLTDFIQIFPMVAARFGPPVDSMAKFVIIGSIFLFAINSYLKYENEDDNYSYSTGVGISFFTGVFGVLLYSILFSIFAYFRADVPIDIKEIFYRALRFFPILFALLFMIPTSFGRRNPTKKSMGSDEVLDDRE